MKEMLMGLLVIVIVYILIEIFRLVVYSLKKSKTELKRELKETALAELERIVYNVVVSINQTLVKEFKNSDNWNEVTKETAFQEALRQVYDQLSEQSVKTLSETFNDLTSYIANRIEVTVADCNNAGYKF